MGLPDISLTLFDDVAAGNNAYVYSTPKQVRLVQSGNKTVNADRVAIAGLINTLGSASTITFCVETGPTSLGPWSMLGYFDTATVASGVATAPLAALCWTRAVTGAVPSVSFEPDQAFFRVGMKANTGTDSSVDVTAYISQKD